MSSAMQVAPQLMAYTPLSDVMDRHEYGVGKNRKLASAGGGRAWSEDEEVYLLQTRLQKMPYKHIAAHLKKTELACRLHFHQLSHGGNRRKRTTSVSSGSSPGQSPLLATSIPSPVAETTSRSASPPGGHQFHTASPRVPPLQLPSLMEAAHVFPHQHMSHRLPTLLPKPSAMDPRPTSASPHRAYPTPPLSDQRGSVLPSVNFGGGPGRYHHHRHGGPSTPPLQLDCSVQPPESTHHHHHHHHHHQAADHAAVDMARLQTAYLTHKASFWNAVAAAYGHGPGVTAEALEQAWKGSCHCSQTTPITPVSSPDGASHEHSFATETAPIGSGNVNNSNNSNNHNNRSSSQDKTRISAILGIDANPRSSREREMVRRMEERVAMGSA